MSELTWVRLQLLRYRSWRGTRPALPPLPASYRSSPSRAPAPTSGGPRRPPTSAGAQPAAAPTPGGGAGISFDPLLKLVKPLAALLLVAGLGMAVVRYWPSGKQGAPGVLRVVHRKGESTGTDGMKDWSLGKGAEVRAGHTLVVPEGSALKLQAGDPKASLYIFGGSRFTIKLFTIESRDGIPIYKLRTFLEKGAAVLKMSTRDSLWGVDVSVPTGVRFISRKLVYFRVVADEKQATVIVGDGVVAALDEAGEKTFVKADQKMISTYPKPLSRAKAADVLQEDWNF